MNPYAGYISRPGWPRYQHHITLLSKSPVLVGIVNILDDVFWVQQNDDIVRKKADGVDAQVVLPSKTEPISATPRGQRTTVTSISAASDQLL
jgi:hypothetical protein